MLILSIYITINIITSIAITCKKNDTTCNKLENFKSFLWYWYYKKHKEK